MASIRIKTGTSLPFRSLNKSNYSAHRTGCNGPSHILRKAIREACPETEPDPSGSTPSEVRSPQSLSSERSDHFSPSGRTVSSLDPQQQRQKVRAKPILAMAHCGAGGNPIYSPRRSLLILGTFHPTFRAWTLPLWLRGCCRGCQGSGKVNF